jgi:hypothetical protein
MKKIASFVSLALATTAFAAGCSYDVESAEEVANTEEAACANPEGTNLMLASLATAMANELHRWDIVNDFEIYRGANYQEMLRLSTKGKAICGSNCFNIEALLSLQDSKNDQKIRFTDGTKLNSWTFASRLTAGWKEQKTCQDRAANGNINACSSEFHYLTLQTSGPSSCGPQAALNTYKAEKGQSNGLANLGGNLSYPDQLRKKLVWADKDSPIKDSAGKPINPYLQFAVISGGQAIEVDPDWCMNGGCPPVQEPGACANQFCSKTSMVNLSGQCCSCQQPTGVLNGTLVKGTGPVYYCQ